MLSPPVTDIDPEPAWQAILNRIPDQWLEEDQHQAFGKFPSSRRMQRGKSAEIHRRQNKKRQKEFKIETNLESRIKQPQRHHEFSSHQELIQAIFPEGRCSGYSYSLNESD